MNWTATPPTGPGFYWCHQRGKTRMVKVWKYTSGDRLFTDEDCGAPLDDAELYAGAQWRAAVEPDPPSNAQLEPRAK